MGELHHREDELLLRKIREILLREDRAALEDVRATLDDPLLLSEKVAPIIEQHLEFLKKNFPREYRQIVSQLIEQKLKDSQAELLDVIYPTLGKMIRKYIAFQFQSIKDGINQQINAVFSVRGLWMRLRYRLLGIDDSEYLLSRMDAPVVEEVYVVQRDSGLLLGSATSNPTLDREVIAGMLTAIKSFVEDAFQRDSEELESIEYGTFKIFIHNCYTYYVAVAMSGTLSGNDKAVLAERILDFSESALRPLVAQPETEREATLSALLQDAFIRQQPFLSTPQQTSTSLP